MPAPVASGGSGRRVGLVPTGKAPPCHGARGQRSFAPVRVNGGNAPTPDLCAVTLEQRGSTLTGRSLQATATGRNAPEPSSSRARRPTVFVGSCRSLARFGCQKRRHRDVTGPHHHGGRQLPNRLTVSGVPSQGDGQ